MRNKTGKKFPKKGSLLPPDGRGNDEATELARLIAAALNEHFETEPHAVKTVMAWTEASDRTVKNWFAGTHGPSGAHLVALARHSERVLGVFLALTQRDTIMAIHLAELRRELMRTVVVIDTLLRRQE